MDKNDRDYTNGEITVHWKPALCIHSTICYNKLRSVFDPAKRPWVNMQGAETNKIIEIVDQCPTNALRYSRNKDLVSSKENIEKESSKKKEPTTKIQIMENGPAIISGNFSITDINETTLAKANTISLCRCGNSSNMPFCDGSHNDINFKEQRD